MTDPMAGYDQAEAEAEARTDEARREQHWREAEQAAHVALSFGSVYRAEGDDYASWLLKRIGSASSLPEDERYDCFRRLAVFEVERGTPSLLRVIANVLEAYASR